MPQLTLPHSTSILIEQVRHHDRSDPHRSDSRLSEVILGGQDGLVNVLGVILGVAAASSDPRIVVAAGLAATFAESVSMAAVAYTSTQAENDLYHSEREREYRHIQLAPDVETQEITEIYQRKGFEGDELKRIVEVITSNPDIWVEVMMAEEFQMSPPDKSRAINSAFLVGLAAIIGSLIPLVPFFFLPILLGIWVSLAISAITLFVVGAYKARVTVGNPGRSGLQMTIIGIASALVGYVVGLLFKV